MFNLNSIPVKLLGPSKKIANPHRSVLELPKGESHNTLCATGLAYKGLWGGRWIFKIRSVFLQAPLPVILNASIFLILLSCSSNIEKTANAYCKCLQENDNLSVARKTDTCATYLAGAYRWSDRPEQIENMNKRLDSLLTATCNDYVGIKKYIKGDLGDWVLLKEKMDTEMDSLGCKAFKQYTNFYYLEANGDTAKLKITGDIWMDRFSNGYYYSYLKLTWISDCSFQIEMIETTEPNRKEVFQQGDVFKYEIIDMKKNYFVMTVSYKESLQQFLLYFIN